MRQITRHGSGILCNGLARKEYGFGNEVKHIVGLQI